MLTQTKWVERKFNFDFPVGVFPSILERLRGTPARLDEVINTLPQGLLSVRVNNGWSIQEHAGHLLDLEALGEQRLLDFQTGAAVLTPADMTNRKTFEANYNSASTRDIMGRFRMTRHELVARLERLNEEEVGRSSLHPRLNIPMRVIDWCYFMAEHDDHHIASMVALGRRRS